MLPTLIPNTVHVVTHNGTAGYPVVEAEVVEVRQKVSRRRPGMETVVVAKATRPQPKGVQHTFEMNLDDELFPGHVLHIDMLDAVEASAKACADMVARERKQRDEWNAMTNAEQCAAMGYGTGRYCGD